MTPATALALTILAAPVVLMVVILAPLLWQLHRSVSAVEDEWAAIVAAVEAARADIDRDALALLDRRTAEIALRVRDRLGPARELEPTFAAVLAEVEALVVA